MKAKSLIIIRLACYNLFLLTACNKPEITCVELPVTALPTNSDPCSATGSILVATPVGQNVTYSLNASFQLSPVFEQLNPGNYDLAIKQSNGCISISRVTVGVIQPGQLYNNVKALLRTNCVSCHGGLNPQAGLNFSRDCDILLN